MNINKDQFFKIWRDSTKADILNQYYYDYKAQREAIKIINKIENYLNNLTNEDYVSIPIKNFLEKIKELEKESKYINWEE